MALKDEMTQDERDFAAAWGGDDAKAAQSVKTSDTGAEGAAAEPAVSEAQGGGAKQGADAGDAEAGAPAAGAAAADDKGDQGAQAGAAMADGGAAAAADAGDEGDGPTDPKDVQRQKSWEGRLKQRERELADREAKLKEAEAKMNKDPEAGGEALEKVAEQAEASGNEQMAEAAEAVAEQVEEGKISPKEAMDRLRADWGDEFIDMMTSVFRDIARQEADLVADGKVKEGVGSLEKRTMDGFRSIGERHMMLHREKIEDAIPGYEKLVDSEGFGAFKANYPDGEKIAEGGTARQIIKMLKAFQESQGDGTSDAGKDQIDRDADQAVAQAQPSEAAIDAAAGVRSGAARVPEAPQQSQDYAGAWAEA